MMPAYIDWTDHGGGAVAPPGVFTNATACAFTFEIDRPGAQRLVDKLLTPGGGGAVDYRVIGDHAFVSFMDVERCGSRPGGSWVPGRECAIWLPLLETRPMRLPRLVVWAPYVFINYSLGLIAGREVWGWPKSIGDIAMPGDNGSGDYVCSTMIFRDTANGSQGHVEPLISVVGAAPPGAAAGAWHDLADTSAALFGAMGLDAAFAELVFPPEVPAIALKQFRHSQHINQACYQAIVNSPCRPTQFHTGGSLGSAGELRIANCGSYRIATALLGAAPTTSGYTTARLSWGGWLSFDFEALAGSVVAP